MSRPRCTFGISSRVLRDSIDSFWFGSLDRWLVCLFVGFLLFFGHFICLSDTAVIIGWSNDWLVSSTMALDGRIVHSLIHSFCLFVRSFIQL